MKCLFLVLCCLSGTLAQMPDPQLIASPDSTLQITAASQQYDFYYSQKQAERFVELSNASYTLEDQIKKNRFRDKTFTQRVARGLPLPDDFDDYVWIGAGTIQEIKLNGEW
jgi:hypothetical protein